MLILIGDVTIDINWTGMWLRLTEHNPKIWTYIHIVRLDLICFQKASLFGSCRSDDNILNVE